MSTLSIKTHPILTIQLKDSSSSKTLAGFSNPKTRKWKVELSCNAPVDSSNINTRRDENNRPIPAFKLVSQEYSLSHGKATSFYLPSRVRDVSLLVYRQSGDPLGSKMDPIGVTSLSVGYVYELTSKEVNGEHKAIFTQKSPILAEY